MIKFAKVLHDQNFSLTELDYCGWESSLDFEALEGRSLKTINEDVLVPLETLGLDLRTPQGSAFKTWVSLVCQQQTSLDPAFDMDTPMSAEEWKSMEKNVIQSVISASLERNRRLRRKVRQAALELIPVSRLLLLQTLDVPVPNDDLRKDPPTHDQNTVPKRRLHQDLSLPPEILRQVLKWYASPDHDTLSTRQFNAILDYASDRMSLAWEIDQLRFMSVGEETVDTATRFCKWDDGQDMSVLDRTVREHVLEYVGAVGWDVGTM